LNEERRQGATFAETPQGGTMDAVVRVQDGRSTPVDASREQQTAAEVSRQDSPADSGAHSHSSYPQNPQAGVQTPEPGVRDMVEPQPDTESEPGDSLAAPLPGDFLLAEYESDCARFVADAKNLARRRMMGAFAH
jgi:hypothetical protein